MAKAKLLHWQAGAVPTGRYRSFDKRLWPHAHYGKDGPLAAMITCDDAYTPTRGRGVVAHAPLRVVLHNYSDNTRPALKARFATLQEAKDATFKFLTAHPEYQPVAKEKTP